MTYECAVCRGRFLEDEVTGVAIEIGFVHATALMCQECIVADGLDDIQDDLAAWWSLDPGQLAEAGS